jgi:hypothetical protein
MSPRANPRRVTWRNARHAGERAGPPYDVNLPPKITDPSDREVAVRGRAAYLSGRDPHAFFAVVRDADRRQREDGDDALTALENALDAAGAEPPPQDAEPEPYPEEPT